MGKRFGAAAVLVCGAMAMACAPPLPPSPSVASLQCPVENIKFKGGGRGTFAIAEGCGRWDAVDGGASLRQRAAFDLQCDALGLDVFYVGGNSFGVTGCGRRATYVWVMNVGFVTDNIQQPSSTPSPTQLK
jgi:hypothetical protein